MAALFSIAVTIIIVGWLWFFVVRPILEDWGVVRAEATVNHSQEVMSHQDDDDYADKADRLADRPSVSADNLEVPRLQLDRTRAAVIEELLTHGWTVADLRREGILRGDNGAIGAEIDAARKRLGIAPPDRTLRVRDSSGARVIPF
jgi:hypothetical protein